jgi:Prokaryotic E2 family E
MLTPEVTRAFEEISTNFRASKQIIREDGEGGAYVILEDIPLGEPYEQSETWVGFRITFQYPYADVYPHFVRGDLRRIDGKPLGEAMSQTTFEGRPAIQLSRRSNKLNPAVDTGTLKLLKVLEWLKSRK